MLSACVPEQPDTKTDHHVVEGVKAHHAHQQVLQNNLQKQRHSMSNTHQMELELVFSLQLSQSAAFPFYRQFIISHQRSDALFMISNLRANSQVLFRF